MATQFQFEPLAFLSTEKCEICGEIGDEIGIAEGENGVVMRVCDLCDIDGSKYNGWGHYQQKCSQCDEMMKTDDVFECSICEVQYCFDCEPHGEKVYDNYCRFCFTCYPGDESEKESDDEPIFAPLGTDTSEGEMYSQRVVIMDDPCLISLEEVLAMRAGIGA